MSKLIRDLNMLSITERNKILYDFNATAVDYPRDKTVHQLFEEQAARTPDKTAVIACDGTLTYSELNAQANRIAHALINNGIRTGDIVAFALHRRSYLIAAMFGILKSGAAYLPIDPDYPQERIDYMLTDSGAKLLITDESIQELLACEDESNPHIAVSPENLCYCIYTSGSTGKPKGTVILHRNLINHCNNNNNNVVHSIIKSEYKNVLSVTTVTFDIFVTESILPTVNGFTILLASETQAMNQAELNEFASKNNADVMQTTPTKMKILIADKSKLDYLRGMKAIMLGGEALPLELFTKLLSLTTARVFNVYGPTEATVVVTNTLITSSDITIGKPIANTQIYILDKYLQPVPIGVTGELCIAGDCVGAGYLNRPELTAEKFVPNPFGEGRMYKTGDLAYWREDGNIVYVGRNDFQVKIRGLRIELGEIENAITQVDGITQAVVIVRKDTSGRQLICAFYTGKENDPAAIRAHIAKRLPKYMLPHIFTHMDSLPMTVSGKLNRNALPDIDLEATHSGTEYVAPVTDTEKVLCRIMESTLHAERVGLHDDFFDMGGDSLKAIEFISKAHAEGIILALQNVFDNPTVAQLTACMNEADKPHATYNIDDFTEIHKLLSAQTDDDSPTLVGMGDTLIVGATGFLGAHILAEYLE